MREYLHDITWGRILTVLLSVAVGWFGAFFVLNVIGLSPSVRFLDAPYEIDGLVTPGSTIDIVYHSTRERDCAGSTSREIWRWTDHNGERVRQIRLLASSVAPVTEIGTESFILSISVPPDIEPGEWFYRAKTTETCWLWPRLAGFHSGRTADLPIRVLTPVR